MLAESFDMTSLAEISLSRPCPVAFPTSSTSSSMNTSHAFLMQPSGSHDSSRPGNGLPPGIVYAHGGPTKHHRPSVNLDSRYFPSCGYAVVLLNHVGSTGYGSAYRDAMDGQWGVEDVQDAVDCVDYLAKAGNIDPKRVGIVGGSAGGYLTLQAICTNPDVWSGAVSLYGISDMKGFARTSHKFESCFDHLLVRGRSSLCSEPHNEPTTRQPAQPEDTRVECHDAESTSLLKLYNDRSPINHIDLYKRLFCYYKEQTTLL
ncbi:Peptidase S9, prolyl oligopeptidase, catalytic domain protein [Metarhizium album ARSEF 1941]|uniref:Peptidase S9, prolyl oligopeptidase, catalytic domain protein n=1 Tax=Metarhizium album (strain ARSEF 1941) TaxID=1081103 RepID=A0A0B2WRE6_METAS|nr:Peptidase S9, prolyl oligopeptidase, catalytic domain protein [Metarhizium album ARSEF 1941]KHN96072.1 Peptidase S9, prolyl oligopeptidase, catalytic domain protein [Metarhizium album ARSEF 1941]